MPAPLLPIFLGLLGGRELVRRRGATRRIESDLDALQAISGGGQFGFNGMGPPTRIGTGQTQLDDVQIATTQAMAVGSPRAALAQALGFAETNRLQGNFETQAALSQAGVTQRKQTHLLQQEQLTFQREQFEFGKEVTALELAEANRALVDPQFSAARAARAGDDFFIAQDQQTGAFEQIPLRGTEPFNAAVKGINDSTTLLDDINRLRTLNRQIGGTRDPANPGVRELQSLHTSILLKLKDAFELGALSGPDIELVLARFPDPTAVGNVLTSTPEALDQAFSSVSRTITDQLINQLQSVRNFQGIDFRIMNRAAQTAFGARRMDQPALQQQEAFLANQALGPGETGAGAIGRQVAQPLLDSMATIMAVIGAIGGTRALLK